MRIIDIREQQMAKTVQSDRERPHADLISFGADTTVLWRWASFMEPVDIDGKPHWWPDLLDFIQQVESTRPDLNRFGCGSPRASRDPDGALLLDAWMHSWKWSGARTIYAPSTDGLVLAALQTGIITPDADIFLGNWAGIQRFERLGRASDFKPWDGRTLKLYHGTTNFRLDDIMELGVLPNMEDRRRGKGAKDTVYFSGNRQRAAYFADQCRKCDLKKASDSEFKRRHPGGKITAAVIEVDVPESLIGQLVADDDWIGLVKGEIKRKDRPDEPHDPSQWRKSLEEFGQVGLTGGLPPQHIVGRVPIPRTVRYPFTEPTETE